MTERSLEPIRIVHGTADPARAAASVPCASGALYTLQRHQFVSQYDKAPTMSVREMRSDMLVVKASQC